jgi:hypothetical protein
MSNPLPDSVVSTLRTNESAALAAAMIIAGAFPDIASFAARVADAPPKVTAPDAPKPRRVPKRRKGHGRRVREAPDQCDERLIAAMRTNPGASIEKLADAIGKSKTSTINALHRLRDADLAESMDRVWSLTEPPSPKETPRWTGPVSAQRRRVETEEREDA